MVHRWNCRHCDFTVWGPSEGRIGDSIKSHIVSHHRNSLSKGDFQLQWECPYCEETHTTYDDEDGLRDFKQHLYSHVEPLLESGTHVANEVDGTGNILVIAPLESDGADNARRHFISPCDIAIFVTNNPSARIRLLDSLDELPAWTILITTVEDPLASVGDVDLSNFPMEIVRLDKGMGLAGLGETLSRVVDEQESATGKLTIEFDILSEISTTFGLQRVFKFLHVLTSRLEQADALAHYYVDPRTESESTINILREPFDLAIEVDNGVFTTP